MVKKMLITKPAFSLQGRAGAKVSTLWKNCGSYYLESRGGGVDTDKVDSLTAYF